jgi:hypothetical protein
MDAVIRTRKIVWTPKVAVQPPPIKESPPEHKVLIQAKTYPKRTGNGHKVEKKRALNPTEKDCIRTWFLQRNGQLENKDCRHFITMYLSDSSEVAIFQITGYVSYLHREVACGRVIPRNIDAYVTWVRMKQGMSNFYCRPNVTEVRKQNWAKISRGEVPNLRIKMDWIRQHKINTDPTVEITGPPRFTYLNTRKRLAWT